MSIALATISIFGAPFLVFRCFWQDIYYIHSQGEIPDRPNRFAPVNRSAFPMAKILHCGKNKIAEPEPVYGFGLGPNKAKAKSAAMNMAHGFAIVVAAGRAAELKCPTEECSKMIGPLVATEATTELVTVKLQNNLYLSVVQRSFDIVIVCQ
jgi:hypothetical protein